MPLKAAMNERARQDVKSRSSSGRIPGEVKMTEHAAPGGLPKAADKLTPWFEVRFGGQGPTPIDLTLPNCAFPTYREDGAPSHVTLSAGSTAQLARCHGQSRRVSFGYARGTAKLGRT